LSHKFVQKPADKRERDLGTFKIQGQSWIECLVVDRKADDCVRVRK
jgi:hypothetical protein